MCTCDNSWISYRVPIKLDNGNSFLKFVKNIKYCLKSEGRNKRVHAFLDATHSLFTRPKRLSNKNEEVYQGKSLRSCVYVIFLKSESTEDD
jgi:hypothetical protein